MGFLGRLFGKEESGPTDAFGRPLGGEKSSSEAGPGSEGFSADVGFDVQAEPREPSAPAISFDSTPIETSWSSVTVNGVELPPDQAQAFTSALDEVKGVGGLDVSRALDLSAIPGLGNELRQVMGQHSHDPAAMQRAVVDVLRRHDIQIPLPPAGGGSPPPPEPPAPTPWDASHSAPPPPKRTPAERLLKLDELRDRGVLTDAEFEEQRRRILGGS
jgi:putative oligomerization/nucleic acid binding protein